MDSSMEWEPQGDGFQVKLRSLEGTFLRANGGPPPWRSSITHDVPHCPATQDWVLWHVEAVDNVEADESFADFQSQISSLFSNDLMDSEPGSPLSTASNKSSKFSFSVLMKSPKLSLPKSHRKSLTALESKKENKPVSFSVSFSLLFPVFVCILFYSPLLRFLKFKNILLFFSAVLTASLFSSLLLPNFHFILFFFKSTVNRTCLFMSNTTTTTTTSTNPGSHFSPFLVESKIERYN